jgi:UDP-2,3-diacylglucosamine hydrolase
MTNLVPAAPPDFYHLIAPAAWQQIDFISDLHLHESEPANFEAWQRYMQCTTADAVFILGDLFEVWPGDDVLHAVRMFSSPNLQQNSIATQVNPAQAAIDSVATSLVNDDQETASAWCFEDRCAYVLAQAARQRPVYFMHGNRDFLLGDAALKACGMQGLPDPTVLDFAGVRTLLSHGDELCLADTDYQVFRQQVRSSAWQTAFLARPLAQRQHIARELRTQSEARKQLGGPWIDLDPAATAQWVQAAGAQQMVHGHTHEGVDHFLQTGADNLIGHREDNSANGPVDGTVDRPDNRSANHPVHRPLSAAQDSSYQGSGIRHVLCDWHADAHPPRAQVLRMRGVAGSAPSQLDVQRLPVDAAG